MTSGPHGEDLLRQQWDVVVVGTGMGGATIGHRLAQAGKRVLFCELGGDSNLRGAYPELASGRPDSVLDASQRDLLLRGGRYADTLLDSSSGRVRSFVPFAGAGPGGSSALYGMALERFMPGDFDGGDWPISYAELAPYYAAAEGLFRVRGDVDPIAAARMGALPPPRLLDPPPLSAAGAELAAFFTHRGLHPYRMPSGCEFVAGCATCQGYLCAKDCKNDAERICLRPALRQHNAAMLSNCRVLSLRAEQRRISGVLCRWAGRDVELRARVVVLAAGALQSPLILLRSEGAAGQRGLGNRSGLVGQRLMRHLIDLYLVRPADGVSEPFDNRRKELACNDFYGQGVDKLGTLQSFGRLPPAAMLFGSLRDDARASRWGWTAPALALARPFLLPVLHDMSERWTTLASIVEDLPDNNNAVAPHPDDPAQALLHYRPTPESMQRALRLRAQLGSVLRGRRWRRLAQAANNQRLAHACGTCRFGDDPLTSVLDRNNRVHDIDNLFVVDSSFFPTSGGTNPGLTVAANALRVGEKIAAGLA